ncbi:heat shock protein beta-9 [Boleophthalmus pectinirostris]|uniref:heat shock protein beta-9 n=1 Tax=Boleophthalmus pectinirostris TaxID=150288 RepID=UPI000A1C3082|nr:heat shock protein beta-9 [Boleophthalmus pectinirostris]
MMSQQSILSSLFDDDPFFSPDRLLWPLRTEALSSIQQDFFNRRAKLADSLFTELHDGPHMPLMSSAFPRVSNGDHHQDMSCMDPHKEVQPASQKNGDLLVTLDARGYAPSDITVKLEGRSLAVAALKQAGAEEAQSCSSSTSQAAFKSSAAARMGFMQRIDLPPHLDLSGLSCSLMDNGQLRIHAPVAKQPITDNKEKEEEKEQEKEEEKKEEEEEEVPLRFRSSLEFPIRKDKTEDQTN